MCIALQLSFDTFKSQYDAALNYKRVLKYRLARHQELICLLKRSQMINLRNTSATAKAIDSRQLYDGIIKLNKETKLLMYRYDDFVGA